VNIYFDLHRTEHKLPAELEDIILAKCSLSNYSVTAPKTQHLKTDVTFN